MVYELRTYSAMPGRLPDLHKRLPTAIERVSSRFWFLDLMRSCECQNHIRESN